jgi:hypothetical protein
MPTVFLLGLLVTLAPWLAVVAANFAEYLGQNYQYRDRFDLTSAAFFVNNLAGEPARYHLGLQDPYTVARAGFWLLVLGVPLALLWLGVRVRRPSGERVRRLLAPALLLPLLFALLISNKQYNYLAPVVPLFALVVAWALAQLLRASLRWFALVLLLLIGAQGALGLAQMQDTARRAVPPESVFVALRALLPPDARVLGKPQYWLAFPEHDYRSIVSLPQLADPHITPAPVPWAAAFAQIAPRIVLIDADLQGMFADRSTPLSRERGEAFDAYLRAHSAALLAELPDERGGVLRVWQLAP